MINFVWAAVCLLLLIWWTSIYLIEWASDLSIHLVNLCSCSASPAGTSSASYSYSQVEGSFRVPVNEQLFCETSSSAKELSNWRRGRRELLKPFLRLQLARQRSAWLETKYRNQLWLIYEQFLIYLLVSEDLHCAPLLLRDLEMTQ